MIPGLDLDRRRELFRICRSRQELKDWIYFFLDLELPDVLVDPQSDTTPLDMAWDVYAHFTGQVVNIEVSRMLYYACRDGGKTLTQAVIEVLALLHLDINVVHLAAIEVQSRNAQGYLKTFLNRMDTRGFLDGNNIRETEVCLYRPEDPTDEIVLTEKEWSSLQPNQQGRYYRVQNKAEIVVATIQSTNGKHAGILCVGGETILQKKRESSGRDRVWTTARGIFRSLKGKNPGGALGGEREEILILPEDQTQSILSMNPDTGDLEFAPIVRAQCSLQESVRIVSSGGVNTKGGAKTRSRSGKTQDGLRTMVCTPSHPCLIVGKGYRQVREIQIGDRAVILGKTHTSAIQKNKKSKDREKYQSTSTGDDWNQVVLGSLLGDAGIHKKKQNNPYIYENHCQEQANYLEWKRKILSLKLRTSPTKNPRSGYTGDLQVGYYSGNSPLLLPYLDVRKTGLGAEALGPLGLAVWYMDDGCAGNGFRLSTEGFDEPTNVRLQAVLKKNFGIEVEIGSYSRDGSTYLYLHGGVESKLRLVEICSPYIHPDMEYKFDLQRNHGTCQWCGTQFLFIDRGKTAKDCGDVVCRGLQTGRLTSEEILKVEPVGERWVYDFTLAKNFNYVSNGFISHNCLDEIDVLSNPAAYAESVNIPTAVKRRDGTTQMPLTILTSTRKSAFGLVQDEINKAPLTGLRIRHFNILDVTEKCLPERHRPDLPQAQMWVSTDELRHVDDATYQQMSFKEKETFSLAVGFNGCQSCKLFVACRGRLATAQTSTSKFLKPIQHVINQFKNNSIEMAKAQLLCWKPSSTGLVYGRLDRMKHILTPAAAYYKVFGEEPVDPLNFTKAKLMDALAAREVGWFGGLDWGSTHNFAYVHGFKDHNRGFITHCVSIAELDPDQMLDVCTPFKRFDPQIYPDTADPKMNKLFKKNGYRMVKWKKGPGSVIGGINIVRWMLNPPMGDPNLYIVRDLGDDPQIDLLFDNLSQYHWKLDAARKPTAVPSEDKDDEPDAFRYAVMNVFDPAAGQIVTSTAAMDSSQSDTPEFSAPGMGGLYDPKHWMTQIIAEKTGRAPNPVQTRAPMEISKPQSYYGDEAPSKGKKGRLLFDI